jgi:transposase
MTAMRKRYSTAFKTQIVLELLKEEQTVNQLAAHHGVHPTQLRAWKKQVLDGLPNLFEQSPEAARLAAVICQGILIQSLSASSSTCCRQGDPPLGGKQLHSLAAR